MSDIDKEYISVYEAARRLRVTPPHLYKLISLGKIATYTRGVSNQRKYVEWHEIQALFAMKRTDDEEGA